MRSRAARVTSSALALMAIAGAAFFLFDSERQLSSRRNAFRTFDQQAREAAQMLADVRAGQQAYVAAGQGVTFWMPKVSALIEQATATLDRLRSSAASSEAQQALVEAAAVIPQLTNVDRRARDYIRGGEQLMAADVVFAEGAELASTAAQQVEAARAAESRTFDSEESARRRLEGIVLGSVAALSALVLALLAFARGPVAARAIGAEKPSVAAAPRPATDAVARKVPTPAAPPPPRPEPVEPARESIPALRAAASLCTDFGSVRDTADLSRLLARAGTLLDATGLIVWLGNSDGGDLRPVLAHGYAEQTLSRIPAVPRSADNAAATAYRTATLQVVAARPGGTAGALVAPILAADGCIGALTAEIRDRGESSDTVQALATIFAAQLAGVLGGSVATGAVDTDVTTGRVASA